MSNQIYYEEVPLHQWASIAIGLFIVALTPLFVLQFFASTRETVLLWFYLVMDLVFIFIILNFRTMRIRVESGNLIVSFGFIKKIINLEELNNVEETVATLGKYTGIGIRFGGDGSMAYLPRLGSAIRVEYGEGSVFVFTSNNIDSLLKILRQYCAGA